MKSCTFFQKPIVVSWQCWIGQLSQGEETITHSLIIKDIIAPRMILIVIFVIIFGKNINLCYIDGHHITSSFATVVLPSCRLCGIIEHGVCTLNQYATYHLSHLNTPICHHTCSLNDFIASCKPTICPPNHTVAVLTPKVSNKYVHLRVISCCCQGPYNMVFLSSHKGFKPKFHHAHNPNLVGVGNLFPLKHIMKLTSNWFPIVINVPK